MKNRLALILMGIILLCGTECRAQRFSISTNLLDYVALGTMNIEGACSVTRRLSITLGARCNPFTFRSSDPEKQVQMRQQSYSLGVRVWPWHTWSGWWFAGKGRYQEYNFGGLMRNPETREGDRFGVGLYAGYTHMLGPHFNIEFGLGLWGGADIYRKYSCQVCGVTVDEGTKGFILPDDVVISLVYVF